MEIFRQDTDYAVRGLLYLAARGGRPVPCAAVAEACDIPKSFAHKIFRKLAGAGIVTSRPGRAGGFCLEGDLSEISLWRLIRVVQGEVLLSRCLTSPGSCPRSRGCPVLAQLRKLQQMIVEFFRRVTLQELADGVPSGRSRAAKRPAKVVSRRSH